MNIKRAETLEDVEALFYVINELRPHLDVESFLKLYESSRDADQYTVLGAFEGDECVGAVGYRIVFDLAHGKHIYIDDLVVSEKMRGKRLGQKLLEYVKDEAAKLDIKLMRLCSGLQREQAHKFYDREGWIKKSYAFACSVSGS